VGVLRKSQNFFVPFIRTPARSNVAAVAQIGGIEGQAEMLRMTGINASATIARKRNRVTSKPLMSRAQQTRLPLPEGSRGLFLTRHG
jgi:hypothetical protein